MDKVSKFKHVPDPILSRIDETMTYTGKDTKATGNLSGNPLFSFITSRLNNWAASAMKGITVTFGFDNYEETHSGVSSKAMRYSYQVSKSLFDDRFKIVIGGNYTQGN